MTTASAPTERIATGPADASMRLEAWGDSDRCRNPDRPRNEDWPYFPRQNDYRVEDESRPRQGELFIVCDGIVGRDAGHEASAIAGHMIRRPFYYMPRRPVRGGDAGQLPPGGKQEVFRLGSSKSASCLAWVRLPR